MTLHRWPYKAKNCEIHDPKSLKNKLDGPWVAFLAKKGRGVATVVCVSHGYRSKLPSIHSNTHKTMATPLLLCYLPMIRQATLGSIFIFLRGLMRVIKKSEVRKIIIGHVELTLIFLFDYLLCKIAILESLKVLFLDKKQKLLSVDGSIQNYNASQ